MVHTTIIKVRFSDLDPYDHVNHARYFSYFESARVEMLESGGFSMGELAAQGIQIVLVEVTARFVSAAVLHEELAITTEVVEMGRVKMTWAQEAKVGDRVVATLRVQAAFTDRDGKPRRPPEGFAQAFSG